MNKKSAPQHFLNRELGLLAFNRRVLALAENAALPLLERFKYLCIVSSNLDEFFEIRVAGLKEQVKLGVATLSADGMNPQQTLSVVREHAHQLIARQYEVFNTQLTPALAEAGIK
ncbi:MAG: polyphosphate kinase 1, partial [Gallionella sp.]